ncbi:RNA pyrophosphohydrolase [Pacificimonas pallii]|uniref:RNA pyrophosphohydrolase n=1 Tax=Pacificimonas pallii TaxID=2827236 RepID=UPI0034E21FF7
MNEAIANVPRHPSGLPYRPCVGIMLIAADSRVFTARRLDNPADYWQMPQGGIDPGEDPQTAALRELKEETGLGPDKVDVLGTNQGWLSYDLPPELLGKIWKGRYCGQVQKWFAMRFTGQDTDIDIETEHPEFAEWRWAEPGTLPEKIVPFKVRLYEDVLKAFTRYF